MSEQAQIGKRLRAIRSYLGETQEAFGEKFELSRDNIANYERGRCDLPDKLLAALDRLGYDLRWLLTGVGEMFRD